MQVPDFDGGAAVGRGFGASMTAAAAGQAIRSFSSAMLATAPPTPLTVALRGAVAFVTATASGSAERGGHHANDGGHHANDGGHHAEMGPGVVDIENEECVPLTSR
jgi:hypothetical protein